VDQTRREINKKVLDRIASDPKFREELLDDPKGTMERAGFKWEGDEDVSGYLFSGGMTVLTGGGGVVSDMITCAPSGGGGASNLATAACDPSGESDPGKTTPSPNTDPPPKQ
jgi:hypothetical protein